MASNSEAGFGPKLYNAEQLSTEVATFSGYSPENPLAILAPFNTLIGVIHTNNNAIAVKRATFHAAVVHRKTLFKGSPESLDKRLSPIGSYIDAKYGNDSPQYESINVYIKKIRSGSSPSAKRNETGEFVSQSQQSFGSKTENFDSMIAILVSYEGEYAPTNPLIEIDTLTTFSTALHTANAAVTTAWGELKPLLDLRLLQYEDLHDRAQCIKKAVKSQYGLESSEYELIKGYKI